VYDVQHGGRHAGQGVSAPDAPPIGRVAAIARAIRLELPPLARLGGPVVLAEIGWMFMGIVDTIMVGPLGPAALGGVGVASSLFFAVGVFGMGALLGLDTVIAQAYGAGDHVACRRWLWQGLWLALALSVPLLGVLVWLTVNVDLVGSHPSVRSIIGSNLAILTPSLWALLVYAAVRRYLQALGLVRPLMFALVTANLVNFVGNWALIYGRLGMPALGTDGAAWATVAARVYMAIVVVTAAVLHDRHTHTPHSLWRVPRAPAARDLRRLAALGLPAAAQISLEVGVFAMAAALASRLTPVALAAHQIALNLAGLTFMIPLGVSAAAAVRVGHAVGARQPDGVRRAGWVAIGGVVVVMSGTALLFLLAPRPLIGLFTRDAAVLATGASLLAVAGMFQIFDGLQVAATGVLRGLGDTHTPMVWNLIGHWAIGLPLGWWLCFRGGWGVVGLWLGLSTGLIIVALVLVQTWARRQTLLEGLTRA
jgi:MATE family multidrug resistance protein